jgi:hypothetical protein
MQSVTFFYLVYYSPRQLFTQKKGVSLSIYIVKVVQNTIATFKMLSEQTIRFYFL